MKYQTFIRKVSAWIIERCEREEKCKEYQQERTKAARRGDIMSAAAILFSANCFTDRHYESDFRECAETLLIPKGFVEKSTRQSVEKIYWDWKRESK